jgi:membrane protein required for colicin V production
MTAVDWAILAVVLLNVIVAAMHGFFAEAFSMAGLVVGYVVAAWRYKRFAAWLMTFLKSQLVAEVLAFLLMFFAILFLFSLTGRIIRKLMKAAGLSGFDRFLGALLGILKGGLLVAVVLMCLTAFAPTSQWLGNSELAPYFLVAGRAAVWLAPSELRARFYEGLDFLHRAPNNLSAPAVRQNK